MHKQTHALEAIAMTDDELRNLMMGSCYIKRTIPGPVHLSSFSGSRAAHPELLKTGSELVQCGYLRQLVPVPDAAQDFDEILGAFELTPFGLENFEGFLRKQDPQTLFGKVDTATVVIQFPWFGGKSTYIDNSKVESTRVDVTLQVALGNIIGEIDKSDASEQDKGEAKSRLKAFLKHPLVVAVAGATVKPLVESL